MYSGCNAVRLSTSYPCSYCSRTVRAADATCSGVGGAMGLSSLTWLPPQALNANTNPKLATLAFIAVV